MSTEKDHMAQIQTDQTAHDMSNGNVSQPNGTASPQKNDQPAHENDQPKVKEKQDDTKDDSKKDDKKEKEDDKPPPAGGFDPMPVPKAPPGYNVRFTFHRAISLPMADINTLSSDPFVTAELITNLPTRHREDPPFTFRTPTIRKNTDPVWNATWVVGNVPASGFMLKARIYDEDPADHDDRLGNVHVTASNINESWPGIHEQPYKIKKRMGSKRAYLIRGCAAMFSRGVHMSGQLIVSAEVLGPTQTQGGRLFTIGPQYWTQHYSPMIGRLTGTKEPGRLGKTEGYNFQANQFQLQGPLPPHLYHRYVEFKPFVKGMFTKGGVRGRILHMALHHQHSRVYNYDRTTVYGCLPGPGRDMTLQFLDMVHYDQGGRIYTYIMTLDGVFRFTETGKEFGIDLLSKHTMHSGVSIYIAFSGEFFVRRLRYGDKAPEASEQESHPPNKVEGGPPDDAPPKDPSRYELVIDNDSGTYRPNKDYLPQFGDFMQANFPGLHIKTMACDDENLNKMKDEQKELKKSEGDKRTFVQGEAGKPSSPDEEDLKRRAEGQKERRRGGLTGGKIEQGLKVVAEPGTVVKNWVEGDKAREHREEREDVAAQGHDASVH